MGIRKRESEAKNQIDHFLISRQLRSAVLDARAQRGADINSDHYLVRTKIQLRLSKCVNTKKFKPRFNTDRLKDRDARRMYCEAVRRKRRRAENRAEEREEIENLWEAQTKAYVESAEEILGFRKGKSKPWISKQTWKLIDERKAIKSKLDSSKSERIQNRIGEEYRQKDKEVKSYMREDKRRWMAEKAQAAQKAAENGRAKELYDITRQVSSKGPRKTAAITNKDVKLLKSKEERQARWKEHFEEVLNREAPPNPPTDEEMEEEELDINTEPPTEEEIRKVVQALKNGKAPGSDQITAELLKADTESTYVELKRLFDLIWQEEKVPEQ